VFLARRGWAPLSTCSLIRCPVPKRYAVGHSSIRRWQYPVGFVLRESRADAQESVRDVDGPARRLDVAESGEEVGVPEARAHPQLGLYRTYDLQVSLQWFAGVDEHIGPGLQGAVVTGTGVPAQEGNRRLHPSAGS
jgi:hypothetical protein